MDSFICGTYVTSCKAYEIWLYCQEPEESESDFADTNNLKFT